MWGEGQGLATVPRRSGTVCEVGRAARHGELLASLLPATGWAQSSLAGYPRRGHVEPEGSGTHPPEVAGQGQPQGPGALQCDSGRAWLAGLGATESGARRGVAGDGGSTRTPSPVLNPMRAPCLHLGAPARQAQRQERRGAQAAPRQRSQGGEQARARGCRSHQGHVPTRSPAGWRLASGSVEAPPGGRLPFTLRGQAASESQWPEGGGVRIAEGQVWPGPLRVPPPRSVSFPVAGHPECPLCL